MGKEDVEYLKAMEAQRRAFEAQFGSLEDMGFEDKTKNVEESDDHESITDDLESEDEELIYGKDSDIESSEDEFHGFDNDTDENDDNNDTKVDPKVIKFVDPTSNSITQVSKEEQKMLKSGKAYRKAKPLVNNSKKNSKSLPDSEENIQNDLELNRFLQESHILSKFNSEESGADLTLRTMEGTTGDTVIGKARRYTQNSRLKEISSINGHDSVVNKLEKVPMLIRKKMVKNYQSKINEYEKEAQENGIILSKVKKGDFRKIDGHLTLMGRIGTGIKSQKKDTFRKKGLKINSVGRNTRNGLVISQKEIDTVNAKGRDDRGAKRGGKRGRRGGRRG